MYRKVFTGNITDQKNKWTALQKCNLENVRNIIDIRGSIVNTKTDYRVLPISGYESSTFHCVFSYLPTTDNLECYLDGWIWSEFGFKYNVIIEYTKTTD